MPDAQETEEGQQAVPEGFFTKAQLDEAIKQAKQQARGEARDQLHDRIAKTDERFKEMQDQVKTLTAAEQARVKAAEDAEAERQKALKAKEEAELSAQELIKRRDAEFQEQLAQIRSQSEQQVAQLRAEQEQRDALFAKEREFQELRLYINQQATAHQNDIAPELIDLISGSTTEEVDASVADLVARTERIVAGMRTAAQAQRAAMPGVSPGGGTAGIVPGLDTGQQQLTPDDIKGMSMKDFAALRDKVGLPQRGDRGQGIFG